MPRVSGDESYSLCAGGNQADAEARRCHVHILRQAPAKIRAFFCWGCRVMWPPAALEEGGEGREAHGEGRLWAAQSTGRYAVSQGTERGSAHPS